MSSSKKRLLAVVLLLLALAVPASVYLVLQQQEIRGRAQPATTLSFDPTSLNKTVGETFTININIDTGSNSISGAEVHVQYDATKLNAISFDIAPTPFLPVLPQNGTTQNGFAFIQLLSQPSQAKQGTGTLATLTFRAAASTAGAPTFIRFTTDTAVAGTGEIGNVLASQPPPASITIGSATTPIPTPSSTPTPVPTSAVPTPTPRGGGGGGGGVGGVATPTPFGGGSKGSTSSGSATGSATPTPFGKGGPIGSEPTKAAIPVTAEVGPTAMIAIGGVTLTILGIISLLAL